MATYRTDIAGTARTGRLLLTVSPLREVFLRTTKMRSLQPAYADWMEDVALLGALGIHGHEHDSVDYTVGA